MSYYGDGLYGARFGYGGYGGYGRYGCGRYGYGLGYGVGYRVGYGIGYGDGLYGYGYGGLDPFYRGFYY